VVAVGLRIRGAVLPIFLFLRTHDVDGSGVETVLDVGRVYFSIISTLVRQFLAIW